MNRYKILVVSLLFSLGIYAQDYPYQNPALSPEERAADLVSRLTLEEKATLMCDVSEAIPRLGIKKFNWWSEALCRSSGSPPRLSRTLPALRASPGRAGGAPCCFLSFLTYRRLSVSTYKWL